tara:strand:+ start:1436 stop:1546 length:111 start_codon:yes stop_codon:yes gene_type:complete
MTAAAISANTTKLRTLKNFTKVMILSLAEALLHGWR